jgi:hypothetical protein
MEKPFAVHREDLRLELRPILARDSHTAFGEKFVGHPRVEFDGGAVAAELGLSPPPEHAASPMMR